MKIEIMGTVRETNERIMRKLRPGLEKCRAYVKENPGLVTGAAAGYIAGTVVEKIPGVKILLGPLPRLVGLAAGAAYGKTVDEVQEEAKKILTLRSHI